MNLTPVQNFLAKKAANVLSKKLKTDVKVAHVRIDFLNHLALEGVYIGDKSNDTILYAGEAQVRISDWFIFKDKPVLQYLALKNAYVHLYRTVQSKEWNYDFLADAFSTDGDKNKDTSASKPFEFDLAKIELYNVRFHMDDSWGGQDQDYDIGTLLIDSKGLDFKNKLLEVNKISIADCNVTIKDYPVSPLRPRRPHTIDTFDFTPFNSGNWSVNTKTLALENCEFHLIMDNKPSTPGEFDYNHIDATQINAYVTATTIRGDTISGKVENFDLKERSGFRIKKMTSDVSVSPIASICKNLYLETNNSKLHNYYAMRYAHFPNFTDYLDSVVMEGNLNNSIVDVRDIAFFAPQLKSWPNIVFNVSGDGKGTVADLHAQNINITDGNSVLKGKLSMKGLPDIYKTYITYSDGEIFTTNAGITRYAPALRDTLPVDIGSIVYAHFRGNYEGYIEDFSVKGILNTNLGTLTTNIKMTIPDFNSSKAVYSGTVAADQIKLGTFVKQPLLGNITFKETISGKSFDLAQAQLKIDGTINEFYINDYAYHNIMTHGTLAKKEFVGSLLVDDPNLALAFDGGINYTNRNIDIKATAHLLNCNFKALHLTKDSITAAADFDLNCTGSNIDNFSGYAKLNNIDLKRNSKKFAIDSVLLRASGSEGNKLLTLHSNDIEATIKGNYQLSKLPASVQYYLSHYIPNYIGLPEKYAPDQNFQFSVSTINIDTILAVTVPLVRGFDSSSFSGSLNTTSQKVTLDANVPHGSIGKFHMHNLAIHGQGNLSLLSLNTTIDNVVIGDSVLNGSLSLTSSVSNDSVTFTVATATPEPSSAITLNGQIIARQDSLFLTVFPSQFFLNQMKWDIAGGSKIVYSDNYLTVQDLMLTSGLQKILAASELQTNEKALLISTENLDLGQFGSWAGFAAYQPDGRVNGTIKIDKIFKELFITANLKGTGVMLGQDTVGAITLIGSYDGSKQLISLDPQTGIYRNNASVIASGNMSFDSTTNQKLDGIIQFNNAPVVWASPFLTGIISRLSGKLNGSVNFGGASYEPIINGNVALTNAGFRVDYLGCNYTIPTANIHIDNRTISYGNVLLFDKDKNTATLSGRFTHNMFKNMRMRLNIKTKKFEVLNLTSNDNDLFYGNITASMDSFTIRGPFDNIRLNIYNAAPAAKSRIYIPYISGGNTGSYSYVSFKTYGKEQEKIVRKDNYKIHFNLDANMNTLAEMHIVLDPSTGDEIMARGDGRIQLDIPPDNDLHITGPYQIDNGTYTITFKSLFLHRNFRLKPNSSIVFNGPFSETAMNVDAIYSAKAKLADLLTETDMKLLQPNEVKDAQTPQLVDVMLHIGGTLKTPKLTFDLDLQDKHSQSSLAYRKLMLINTDDRQKTAEVASLLALNTFIPPEGIGSSAVASGALNNFSQVISSSASTGLTNIVNKLTGDNQVNIDVKYTNYNYTNQALGGTNRNQVNLVASKNINNRLDLSIGSTSDWGRPTSSASSTNFNFTGNFRLQYKLSYTSGLRLNAFRTSDYDVTINQNIVRQGVGITWRKSFDGFGDFFRSNKYLVKQKELQDQKMQIAVDSAIKHPATP